jgi:hypothetical protein
MRTQESSKGNNRQAVMDGAVRMSLLPENTYESSSLKDMDIRTIDYYKERMNYLDYLPLYSKYEIDPSNLQKLTVSELQNISAGFPLIADNSFFTHYAR